MRQSSRVAILLLVPLIFAAAIAHADKSGLLLPYPAGSAYRCTQGTLSSPSHKGRLAYSLDFNLPTETKVAAAGGGTAYVHKGNGLDDCSRVCVGGKNDGERRSKVTAADDCPDGQCRSGNFGNHVTIDHGPVGNGSGDRYFTVYAHLASFSVTNGQSVLAGDEVGVSNETGYSCGAHLHFALHRGDPQQDAILSESVEAPSILVKELGTGGDSDDDAQTKTISVDDFVCGDAAIGRFYEAVPSSQTVLQLAQDAPGEPGKDIWTTSVFCYCPGGGGPGGGLDDHALVVGGWADLYYSLIQFDLRNAPARASSAKLELYAFRTRSGATTGLYLDRVTSDWDWRVQGTGEDMERLWWADRPPAEQWIPEQLPAPTIGEWYQIDITDLYNAWQDGTYENHGIQLRPVSNNNQWAEFYSSNFEDDPSLRPRLVITPE